MTEEEVLAEFRAAGRAARGAFHPLLRPAQPALPAMRAGADGPGARLAPRRGAGRRDPARAAERSRDRRLAGDGRGHHRPRNGPRARRRGDVRRAADRHVRAAPRLPARRRARRCCWSRTSSPPASRRARRSQAIAEAGGEVIAAAALVDRSEGRRRSLGVPFFPLAPPRRADLCGRRAAARARRDPRREAGEPRGMTAPSRASADLHLSVPGARSEEALSIAGVGSRRAVCWPVERSALLTLQQSRTCPMLMRARHFGALAAR